MVRRFRFQLGGFRAPLVLPLVSRELPPSSIPDFCRVQGLGLRFGIGGLPIGSIVVPLRL